MSLTYSQAVEQTIAAGEQIHQIVNGTATTEVTVEDGSKVPSIRKALLDNFYFKDPIAWQVGQTENVFNQLRQFTDGSWWYAPSATASNPIFMGSTPVGNPLWKIYDFDAIGKLEPRIDEALRRSYAEAGYNLVAGSFEAGGTLTSGSDVMLHEASAKTYSGEGPFPQTVPPETNPASAGFVAKNNEAIRAQLAASTGTGLIGWIRSATGAVLATLGKWLGYQPASVLDFMTDAERDDVLSFTGALDLSAALQKARDHIASGIIKRRLEFPAGVYSYSVSPNWAISNAEIIANGEVRFKYTGTGNAVIIDAGYPSGNTYNLKMLGFIVEAASTAQNGVFIRSVHHSKLNFRVLTAGAAHAGIMVHFAVCTHFDSCATTGNVPVLYGGVMPKYGLYLDRRNENEQVSYCLFTNPIFELTDVGVHTDWTLGNMFIGGTFEACATRGMETTVNSLRDIYDHIDFEGNRVRDIVCLGRQIEFRSCDTTKSVFLAGAFNKLMGGNHETIEIDTNARQTSLGGGLVYRRNDTGSLVDAGQQTNMRDLIRVDTGGLTFTRHNAIPSRITPTVGASPFLYTNNTGNEILCCVIGGTVTQIVIRRPGFSATGGAFTSGFFPLQPGDSLDITYTAAPGFVVLSQ